MKKFEKFVIASDLDGTFFGENMAILPKNLEAIEYFKANGGVFLLSTGRDFKMLETVCPILKDVVSGPSILCNGTYLYDFAEKKKYEENEVDKEEILAVLEAARQRYPQAAMRISCDMGFLCPDYMTSPLLPPEDMLNAITYKVKIEDYLDISWHKLVFSAGETNPKGFVKGEKNWILGIRAMVENMGLKNTFVTTSGVTLLEFLKLGTGKGQAVNKLRKYYPDRTIVCVGDYENDKDMLRVADISACPENALDSIKALCKIHLCHHREGCIADLIYKLDSSIKE